MTPLTYYAPEKAQEIIDRINELDDAQDDWTYAVARRGDYAVIEVYDEENILLGYL